MAKFIKSIFQTQDKKKDLHENEEEVEERNDSPAVGSRRQLSISRSGRMRQATKKRHSLALELYGDDIQFEAPEKPTVREYHVNSPVKHNTQTVDVVSNRINDTNDCKEISCQNDGSVEDISESEDVKTPEEEIDNAFGNIDKS